tara:strand:+ start:22674 stop:23375 length:702 start_codon:yes stop_codon:yes gene_type:complete
MSSSRFPNKVLEKVNGVSMIEFMYQRVQQAKLIDKSIIITSTEPSDDKIEELCLANNIPYVRGDLDDVLNRFYQAYQKYPCHNIVRLTGDCPLIDPSVIDLVLEQHINEKNEYTSNINPPTFPDGYDVEVLTSKTLEYVWETAKSAKDREHVTYYIRTNDGFKSGNLKDNVDNSHLRVTVDYKEDLTLVNSIISELGIENLRYQKVSEFLNNNEKSRNINNNFKRNEALPELE